MSGAGGGAGVDFFAVDDHRGTDIGRPGEFGAAGNDACGIDACGIDYADARRRAARTGTVEPDGHL